MKTPVAIIGGGPCGLAASLLLARHGVPNVLLEKHPGISPHPKAMGITRRTAEIFRSQALLRRLEEKDILCETGLVTRWSKRLANGDDLGDTPVEGLESPHTPCRPLHCPQPVIESTLRAALETEKASTTLFDRRMVSFEEDDTGVEISHEARGGGDPRTLRAEWMIAADGDGSPTRKALGIETEGPGDLGHFLNVFFRACYGKHIGRRALLHNILNEDGFEVFVAVDNRKHWLMHHFLDKGERPEDYNAERCKEIIRAMSGIPGEEVEILGINPWVMSPKIASAWRHGRVFLTGDASARLSPAGGLGMNTGLQSVHNLAWKLAVVVRGESDASLLDSYGQERLGIIGRIFENSTGNADEVFSIVGKGLSGDWEGARREIAASRRRGSQIGLDLGLAYPGGAFLPDESATAVPPESVNEFSPDARPGIRAPHLDLGGGMSILDRFGKTFTLVCGPNGHDWETAAAGLPADASFPLGLSVLRPGRNLTADADTLESSYGIPGDGAVLVRPDGIVGARWKRSKGAKRELESAAHFFRGRKR